MFINAIVLPLRGWSLSLPFSHSLSLNPSKYILSKLSDLSEKIVKSCTMDKKCPRFSQNGQKVSIVFNRDCEISRSFPQAEKHLFQQENPCQTVVQGVNSHTLWNKENSSMNTTLRQMINIRRNVENSMSP